jgi:long-chain acyl-CoA synthetase
VLQNGRLRTGDVGYIDEDGYIFLVDRIKDLIIAGGFNIYPRNVEEAIYQHPAVLECIVLGVPDAYRGQTVKAFIVLRDGMTLDAEELDAFLTDKLSPIERPKFVEFRTILPKTAIGKLSRKALAEEEERAKAPA